MLVKSLDIRAFVWMDYPPYGYASSALSRVITVSNVFYVFSRCRRVILLILHPDTSPHPRYLTVGSVINITLVLSVSFPILIGSRVLIIYLICFVCVFLPYLLYNRHTYFYLNANFARIDVCKRLPRRKMYLRYPRS